MSKLNVIGKTTEKRIKTCSKLTKLNGYIITPKTKDRSSSVEYDRSIDIHNESIYLELEKEYRFREFLRENNLTIN